LSAEQRGFLIRFGIAILLTIAVAPIAGAFLPDTMFHRILTRCFLVSMVLCFLWGRAWPRTWPAKIRSMGLRGPDRLRRVAAGFVAAVVLFGALVVVSWLAGGRAPPREPHDLTLAAHVLKALGMAIGVALMEELLCRGYFQDVWGGPISALIYSAAHLFHPPHGSAPSAPGYHPLEGAERAWELFTGWGELRAATVGLLSLFLLGLALSRLRERTGTLYLGIGLHGGLVFAVELYRRWLDSNTAGDPWVFGGPRLYDGLLATLVMAVLLWFCHRGPIPAALRDRA